MLRLALLALLVALLAVACRSIPAEQPKVGASPAPAEVGPSSTLVQRGQTLYQANCQSCHGGATGGSMMDMPPRHNQYGHTWHHPDCQLTEIVLNGSGEMGEMMRRMMPTPEGTPRMPAFREQLTREDVAAVLAFIKTWWTDGQRVQQAEVTRAQC